ncbi:MAG: type I methionyl aminopeptidase [Gammaproteobacteria bacterium]|nr:type I methionyl aminopeptidase [Gammaproteobacteria bacterium]
MINIKNKEEQEKMRRAGKLASEVLDMISNFVTPGITTGELDRICHDYIVNKQKAIPANLNYKGFPATICTSVNHVVCHGIPGIKKLKHGDIINIDVTVIKDEFHGDTSRMFLVGRPTTVGERISRITYESMWKGIKAVKPGNQLGDIGHAIQSHAEKHGYSIVKEYCGHGIGKIYHDDPQILHYGKPGLGIEIKEGMTFTIEPMINAGKASVRLLPDQWTVVTRDHSLSAQWEHTILVTKNSFEVLTLAPNEKTI